MNTNVLIDNIVRQTTVLLAQLATSDGGRAQLDSVANQVFLDLVSELKRQGLGNKVIADMFGLALRTYHDRVRRLSESATFRGNTLWSAVLTYVRQHGLVSRASLLRRFHADDEVSVRGVLNDLVESGLLFRSGRADTTTFRAAEEHELATMATSEGREEATAQLAWVVVHQNPGITRDALAEQLRGSADLDGALTWLVEKGHVRAEGDAYVADACVIPLGSESGWEAAVFDHYQALVGALVAKLSREKRRSGPEDAIGGSTYHFDLYPGHPLESEVLTMLERVRRQASALRMQVDAASAPLAAEGYRVVFYAGQNVIAHATTLPTVGDVS